MAVRLRLMRMGKTKQPIYRVVVMDQRAPRDGRYIEQIGRYDARQEPSLVEIDNERALEWLAKGAQPSETVEKLLNVSGAMNTMKIKTGGIHVVGVTKDTATDAPAASQDSGTDDPETGRGSETDAPAASQDSGTDDPAAGGGSEGGRPPSQETETDAPATTPSPETDVPETGGGSEGGRPPSQGSETDAPAASQDSGTDDPAAGGGSRGVAPPDNETEEE